MNVAVGQIDLVAGQIVIVFAASGIHAVCASPTALDLNMVGTWVTDFSVSIGIERDRETVRDATGVGGAAAIGSLAESDAATICPVVSVQGMQALK